MLSRSGVDPHFPVPVFLAAGQPFTGQRSRGRGRRAIHSELWGREPVPDLSTSRHSGVYPRAAMTPPRSSQNRRRLHRRRRDCDRRSPGRRWASVIWSPARLGLKVPRRPSMSWAAATTNIGLFIPNAFAAALIPRCLGRGFTRGAVLCKANTFTYTCHHTCRHHGHPRSKALGGTTTQNDTGSLLSAIKQQYLTGRATRPPPAIPALDLSGIPAARSDPAVVDLARV